MKIVLDTNVLSELMKPQGSIAVKNWVAMQPRQNLFTTSITQAEILYGIGILPDGKRAQALKAAAQAMFIEDFNGQILVFEEKAAGCFAEIAAYRNKIGNLFLKWMPKLRRSVWRIAQRLLPVMLMTSKIVKLRSLILGISSRQINKGKNLFVLWKN
jgi:toxin FitB